MPEAKQTGWILHSHGQGRKFGPLSEDELRSYFRAGMVKSVDRLSSPGDEALHAAADVAAALGEAVPVGPPPPPEVREAPKPPPPPPVPAAGPARSDDGEERAARAAAAMNIDLAAMMATSAPAKKSSGWIGPAVVVAVMVVMLYVGLGMVRKLKPQGAPEAVPAYSPEAPPAAPPAMQDETAPPTNEQAGARAIPTSPPAAAPPPSADTQQFQAKAEALKSANDWAGLVAYATQWSRQQPDRNEPLEYLGVAHAGLGNLAEAETAFRKVLARSPQDPNARALLAQVYEQAQRYDEAAAIYQQMVAEKPNDAAAWNNYGAALSGAGQPTQAVAALENAVRLDPSMKQAWTNLGNLYQSMGDQAKARAAFANAR